MTTIDFTKEQADERIIIHRGKDITCTFDVILIDEKYLSIDEATLINEKAVVTVGKKTITYVFRVNANTLLKVITFTYQTKKYIVNIVV